MKTRNWLLLAVSLVPARAWTQVTPPAVNTNAVFATMQRNVDNIKKAPAERDRWNANVAMWRIALGDRGRIRHSEVAPLETLVAKMKGNVGEIMEAGEDQRWLANVTLWQAFIDGDRTPTKSHDAVFMAFEKMKKNVARLKKSPEKERWEANIDLWQSMFARQP